MREKQLIDARAAELRAAIENGKLAFIDRIRRRFEDRETMDRWCRSRARADVGRYDETPKQYKLQRVV
jgi:hypothetical protein